MNTVTKFAFTLIIVPFTILSCDPAKEFETQLNDIDAKLAQIDSLEILLDGIDFDSLTIMVGHVKANEAEIKRLYKPDTLNETFGRQMNDCKSIRKKLGKVGNDQNLYGDELNAIKHQFLDLKDDIKNGVLNETQITEYIAVENAALDKVSLSFGSFYNMVSAESYRYYVVVPKVDAFIADLKTRNVELE